MALFHGLLRALGIWPARPDPARDPATQCEPHVSKLGVDGDTVSEGDLYSDIEPLDGFDWTKKRAAILHPYKAPYQLLFGMNNITVSELFDVDQTYGTMLKERKRVIDESGHLVIGSTSAAHKCVEEMYRWMTATYLPRRFPTMFCLQIVGEGNTATHLHNLVDGVTYALQPSESIDDMLSIMGSLMDEDLHFMLPSADGSEYILGAFVNCFANGNNTLGRLNLPLSKIHGAVPKYSGHLSTRLNQWFKRLQPGTIVMRSNWAMTDSCEMFNPNGHVAFDHSGPIDASKLFIRTERQTLRRLQSSGAIVFALKTYMYPLADIKTAGLGQELCNAIDGLDMGNAAGMSGYKKADIWGGPVKEYLRSS